MSPSASSARTRDGDYAHLVPLQWRYAAMSVDDPARDRLREQLINGYLPMAEHIARRYAGRGEPLDDLVQVATVGLINAVDRFEPDRGFEFAAFAVPTITGEVRRYFRDLGWSMMVPRRLKDLHLAIRGTLAELSQQLGRAPRPSEIAAQLGVPASEVIEGLRAGDAYRSSSLDEMLGTEQGSVTLGDLIGGLDADLTRIEDREALRPLLADLEPRERAILTLRFFRHMTQTQIAEQMGISQMHVSRLLRETMAILRERISVTD